MEEQHEVLDVSLLDRVQRARRFIHDDGDVTEQTLTDHIPEELMSALDEYVGDANARITVSGALSSNHEFHKAESFVSISVACNNHMEDIVAVHDLVRPVVADLVEADHHEMSLLRDSVLPSHKQLHGTELESKPARRNTAKTSAKPAAKAKAKAKTNGKPKPSFRR